MSSNNSAFQRNLEEVQFLVEDLFLRGGQDCGEGRGGGVFGGEGRFC